MSRGWIRSKNRKLKILEIWLVHPYEEVKISSPLTPKPRTHQTGSCVSIGHNLDLCLITLRDYHRLEVTRD